MKPTCLVMVGLPATGKTTLIKTYVHVIDNFFLYSTDKYIESMGKLYDLTYDEAFPKYIKDATEYMNIELQHAISEGKNILWDQTNLSAKKRKGVLNILKNVDYEVHCKYISPPETVDDVANWNKRLHSRPGKTIPDHIIQSMIKSYTIPSVNEGFDTVTEVRI